MINVALREIIRCEGVQKKAVRDVRNQLSVRKSMYTEHEIALDEHLDWLERLGSDTKQSRCSSSAISCSVYIDLHLTSILIG